MATQPFNVSLILMQFTGCREFSIPIGQKMQLTGWNNGNEMRHAWTQKLPTVRFLYCDITLQPESRGLQ